MNGINDEKNLWLCTRSISFLREDMLSANNQLISASHESENHKKEFVWDYEGNIFKTMRLFREKKKKKKNRRG